MVLRRCLLNVHTSKNLKAIQTFTHPAIHVGFEIVQQISCRANKPIKMLDMHLTTFTPFQDLLACLGRVTLRVLFAKLVRYCQIEQV